VTETEFEEFMDFTGTESRQSREFVDDDSVKMSGFDISAESLVLVSAISLGPADDICILVNLWAIVCVLSECTQFVKLSLWVLVCC
jgi:hypothetical protein